MCGLYKVAIIRLGVAWVAYIHTYISDKGSEQGPFVKRTGFRNCKPN
jgi:hypothetical protein